MSWRVVFIADGRSTTTKVCFEQFSQKVILRRKGLYVYVNEKRSDKQSARYQAYFWKHSSQLSL